MPYSVIYLKPRSVAIGHCENCGLSHAFEETGCIAAGNLQRWPLRALVGWRSLLQVRRRSLRRRSVHHGLT